MILNHSSWRVYADSRWVYRVRRVGVRAVDIHVTRTGNGYRISYPNSANPAMWEYTTQEIPWCKVEEMQKVVEAMFGGGVC